MVTRALSMTWPSWLCFHGALPAFSAPARWTHSLALIRVPTTSTPLLSCLHCFLFPPFSLCVQILCVLRGLPRRFLLVGFPYLTSF